ncbi:MAG: lysophospholipase [Cellvibrionaceae bacterium]|nr:lysophospholipase [Cellvibrionaceae bacterium]
MQKHAKSVWPSADWLLIEKRGITAALPHSSDAERADCPSEYIQHDNPRQRIDDIQHVLEQILQGRNYPHVIVIGGSEGAAVAAMYAAQAPFLRAAILINGGGRYFLDDVLHNIRSTVPAEHLEEELNGFNGFAMHILTAEPFDLEVSNHGYAWWKEILTTDFQSVLNSIKIPTLIIQSGLDKSVSPAGVTAMIESIRTDGKTNFDFVVYPDLDHGLMNSDGNSRADKVIQDANLWLRKRIFAPSGN